MNEIINWLNSSRDYYTGVALYEQFGSSASQKRLLRMGGPTKRNQESLEYELSRLVKGLTPGKITSQPVQRPIQRKAPDRPQHHPPAEVPMRRANTPEVDQLKDHIRSLMKARDSLHATLEYVKPEQRGKDAQMILDISDEITQCYLRLEHYDKNGVLPPKKTEPEKKKTVEMDIQELMAKQHNLRTYVSRYKVKMKKAKTPEAIERNRENMEKYQLQLDEVDKLLQR